MVAQTQNTPGEITQQQVADALMALQVSPGWKIIAENIKANIAVLDQQILDKRTVDGEPLDDLECDRLRDKRGYLKEIGDTPQSILDRIRQDNNEPGDATRIRKRRKNLSK